MGRLDNTVAVITGAASGIGRATSIEFAREGACVVAADLRAADETVAEIRRLGARAEPVVVDVTKYDQVERMLQTALDRFGRLDVLYNNAGIPQSFTPFEESSDELFERIFDVNVKGVFYGCRAVVPHFKLSLIHI